MVESSSVDDDDDNHASWFPGTNNTWHWYWLRNMDMVSWNVDSWCDISPATMSKSLLDSVVTLWWFRNQRKLSTWSVCKSDKQKIRSTLVKWWYLNGKVVVAVACVILTLPSTDDCNAVDVWMFVQDDSESHVHRRLVNVVGEGTNDRDDTVDTIARRHCNDDRNIIPTVLTWLRIKEHRGFILIQYISIH